GGAFDAPDVAAKFRGGYKQRGFSFEIISMEGYIQFIIRTEQAFQDLVESAVYAQYPDAEVVAVEDYVGDIPDVYPNDTHDVWAADFGLAENDAYPIRNYHEFEHSISKDTVLKDPMGAFLESFSRIGPGEQMWFQIIIEPTGNSWKEKSIKKIKEIIGDSSAKSGGNKYLHALGEAPIKFLESVGDQVFTREASSGDAGKDKKDEPNQLRYLTPGQTKLVEAMEEKMTQIGFKTKMRGIYVARKEVFRPTRGVQALIGSMNQYNSPTANSIVPKFGVSASYFFKEPRIAYRKKLLMQAYKKRKLKVGANPFIMNVVELATVWHFPMSHVKTPNVQRVEARQSEPPTGLPIERVATPGMGGVVEAVPEKKKKEFVTDAYGYSGDMKFG
ncbi:MAG: hypothetical protein COU33_02715, partial [Candidatus Magasanikbacteria bacterium CG10_big_fil_rev_8_21_14_0_10_43_6]